MKMAWNALGQLHCSRLESHNLVIGEIGYIDVANGLDLILKSGNGVGAGLGGRDCQRDGEPLERGQRQNLAEQHRRSLGGETLLLMPKFPREGSSVFKGREGFRK